MGWDDLNEEEKKFVWKHPVDFISVASDAEIALDTARTRFGKGSLHNGAGDAFRHCFWNAMMARDIGKTRALEYSTAHEAGSSAPLETEMDLYNNSVGAGIGAFWPNATNPELEQICVGALLGGQLKVIVNGKVEFYSTK
jgi:hypothetical protein